MATIGLWATTAAIAMSVVLAGCGPKAAAGDNVAAGGNTQTAVTVTGNGLLSDGVSGDETEATCAGFRLTAAQVRDYLARAKTVDAPAYDHDLDASRCYARGSVRLANGETGTWTIDQARRGQLILGGTHRRYMVCTTCPAPPFFPDDGG